MEMKIDKEGCILLQTIRDEILEPLTNGTNIDEIIDIGTILDNLNYMLSHGGKSQPPTIIKKKMNNDWSYTEWYEATTERINRIINLNNVFAELENLSEVSLPIQPPSKKGYTKLSGLEETPDDATPDDAFHEAIANTLSDFNSHEKYSIDTDDIEITINEKGYLTLDYNPYIECPFCGSRLTKTSNDTKGKNFSGYLCVHCKKSFPSRKGKQLMIYEDPLTKTKPEAKATLKKFISFTGVYNDIPVEMWSVTFVEDKDDNYTHNRTICEPY